MSATYHNVSHLKPPTLYVFVKKDKNIEENQKSFRQFYKELKNASKQMYAAYVLPFIAS